MKAIVGLILTLLVATGLEFLLEQSGISPNKTFLGYIIVNTVVMFFSCSYSIWVNKKAPIGIISGLVLGGFAVFLSYLYLQDPNLPLINISIIRHTIGYFFGYSWGKFYEKKRNK